MWFCTSSLLPITSHINFSVICLMSLTILLHCKFIAYLLPISKQNSLPKYTKTKIMASSPIASWQIEGEKVEAVIILFFPVSKITADGDYSLEIKRSFLFSRKAMTNLDSILKSRDITADKDLSSQRYIFFPAVMCGCESWTIKKAECWRIDAFKLWCGKRLLRVP